MSTLWLVISAAIGGVLLAASVPKLRDTGGLRTIVRGYRLLPEPLVAPVAVTLPYAEVVLGGLLLTGLFSHVVPALAAGLFVVFLGGLTINLLRGRRDLDCGCFAFDKPHSTPRIGWGHAVRAAVLATVSALLAATPAPADIGLWAHLGSVALGLLTVAAVFAVLGVVSIVHPGRHSVDTYLAAERAALRATRR